MLLVRDFKISSKEIKLSLYIKNYPLGMLLLYLMNNFLYKINTIIKYSLNLSYTRLTYVMAKADKNKQEKFKNDFGELKKCLNSLVNMILF